MAAFSFVAPRPRQKDVARDVAGELAQAVAELDAIEDQSHGIHHFAGAGDDSHADCTQFVDETGRPPGRGRAAPVAERSTFEPSSFPQRMGI
jgi:hypothetical protein